MNKLYIPESRSSLSKRPTAFFQTLVDLNALHLSHDGSVHYCKKTGATTTETKYIHDRRNKRYIFSLKFEYKYPGLT